MASDFADRFFDLFQGSDRSHGVYQAKLEVVSGTKNEGEARTVQAPPTAELWERHLRGVIGLGIVPVRSDGTCVWAAVDVDDYRLDLPALVTKVKSARLPILVVRTKSGGAHLFIFFSSAVAAADARAILKKFIKRLRLRSIHAGTETDCEIFPAQDRLGEQNLGNWLNMPYQAGERSLRYGLDPDTGAALEMSEFLDLAYERALSAEAVEEWLSGSGSVASDDEGSSDATEDPRWPGAPPCLTHLFAEGAIPGLRNELLFNATLYFKRSEPTRAEERVLALAASFSPPKDPAEVRRTIHSAMRRPYNYRCRNPPLVGLCQREVCLTRRHGVAGHGMVPGETREDGRTPLDYGTLCKILLTPPVWVWDVSGFRVELTTEQLLNQKLFLMRVFEESNVMGVPMRPATWATSVARAAATAPQLKPPPDATEAGLIWVTLARYCTGRAQARTIDELLMGKPFTQNGRTLFCASDFLAHCHTQRVPATERSIFKWLHDRGLEHAVLDLKGKQTDVWSVPAFDEQTVPFEVPRDPDAAAAF